MELFDKLETPSLFESSAKKILSFLSGEFGFTTVAISRVVGTHYQILLTIDSHFGLQEGDLFEWSRAYCPIMLGGDGPNIVHDVNLVPCYAEAPVTQEFGIGAYFGYGLVNESGSLFGTVFGVNPTPVDKSIGSKISCLSGASSGLSCIIHQELKIDSLLREVAHFKSASLVDTATGMPLRNAWDRRLKFECAHTRKLGTPVKVVAVRTESSQLPVESSLAQRPSCLRIHSEQNRIIGSVLEKFVKKDDFFARISDDEFGVMLVGSHAHSEEFELNLVEKLRNTGMQIIAASACNTPREDLCRTFTLARRRTITQAFSDDLNQPQAA